ncbi:MAG: hypothetical protein Tsb0014_07870 [Pleurocapsa sp.]
MTLSDNGRFDKAEDIPSQLSKLDKQLISYKVIDRQGIFRATVADIYYAADESVNLLIELESNHDKLNLRCLKNSDICQINIAEKLISSNLSYQEIENLPLYQPVPAHLKKELTASPLYDDCGMNPAHNNNQNSNRQSEIQNIPLLEEKLKVTRRKQKIGEVVIRKQVETRTIKVPIRREKLIVERIGKNPEQLTEVTLAEEKVNGFSYQELNNIDNLHLTQSNFLTVETAQQLLDALAHLSSAANARIRLEIVSTCTEHQQEHQNICDRYD